MTHFKVYCFFCNHIITKRHRTLVYKDRPVKICMSCNSNKHKVVKREFKNCKIDCIICTKRVMNKSCILCHNCNHFVHSKCANLENSDVNYIEKHNISWFCPTCIESILPINAVDINKNTSQQTKPKRSCKVVADQCFVCTQPILKNMSYINKHALYNNNPVTFCVECSEGRYYSLVKDHTLLEFLDCTVCKNIVKYESILCSICMHWSHLSCYNLTQQDVTVMSTDNYGDWICRTCLEEALPLITETKDETKM